MTNIGVISENVREIYAREIEVCYIEAGKKARGLKFLDCLKRQVSGQQDALQAIYDARMSYLSSYSQVWLRLCKRLKLRGRNFVR